MLSAEAWPLSADSSCCSFTYTPGTTCFSSQLHALPSLPHLHSSHASAHVVFCQEYPCPAPASQKNSWSHPDSFLPSATSIPGILSAPIYTAHNSSSKVSRLLDLEILVNDIQHIGGSQLIFRFSLNSIIQLSYNTWNYIHDSSLNNLNYLERLGNLSKYISDCLPEFLLEQKR